MNNETDWWKPKQSRTDHSLCRQNNSSVVTVIYDEDGDWQFLGAEEIDESDAVVLSMKEMIKHDGTLYNVPELECGQSAVRENIHSPWRIK